MSAYQPQLYQSQFGYAPQQQQPQQYGYTPQQQPSPYGYAPQQQQSQSQRRGGGGGGEQNQLLLNGIRPPESSQSGQPQGPLDKKVMVLYVVPGEKVSMQAWQMVVDYPEVLVQDARQITPRPQWLAGVPTVVMVGTKTVYEGPKAFQAIASYVQNLKAMSGPQSEMVVPTVDPNSGFAVAGRDVHYKACAEERRTAAVPVGTTTRTAMTVGQVSFAQEDDPRYYSTQKGVSETELNNYISMREQKRQHPVQYRPSVLENGEFVTM